MPHDAKYCTTRVPEEAGTDSIGDAVGAALVGARVAPVTVGAALVGAVAAASHLQYGASHPLASSAHHAAQPSYCSGPAGQSKDEEHA
jgi:hypothetical protein